MKRILFVLLIVSVLTQAKAESGLWLYGDTRHDDTAVLEQVLRGNRCIRWADTLDPVFRGGGADLRGKSFRLSRPITGAAIPRFAVYNGHISAGGYQIMWDAALPLFSDAACPWAVR